MVEMNVVYEGELHTRAKHEPSGAALETDAPVDNLGRGEAFSPTDLLAASLASCMLTTLAIVGGREGFSVDGGRARLEKHMELEPRRRVGRVVVALELPASIASEQRPRVEEVARSCPVAASLHPETRVDLTIDWC